MVHCIQCFLIAFIVNVFCWGCVISVVEGWDNSDCKDCCDGRRLKEAGCHIVETGEGKVRRSSVQLWLGLAPGKICICIIMGTWWVINGLVLQKHLGKIWFFISCSPEDTLITPLFTFHIFPYGLNHMGTTFEPIWLPNAVLMGLFGGLW